MNIDEEIKNLISAITKKGIFSKIIGFGIFILALGSLSQITSTILEIRGLLRDGVFLYQEYLVDPIINFGKLIGLIYTTDEFNAATLASIGITASMRVLIQGHEIAFDEINKIYNSELKPSFWPFYLTLCVGSAAMWLYYGLTDNVDSLPRATIIFFVGPAIIVITKLISSKFGGGYFERDKFSYAKSYYTFLLMLFVVLLILIAISNGLTHDIPS